MRDINSEKRDLWRKEISREESKNLSIWKVAQNNKQDSHLSWYFFNIVKWLKMKKIVYIEDKSVKILMNVVKMIYISFILNVLFYKYKQPSKMIIWYEKGDKNRYRKI